MEALHFPADWTCRHRRYRPPSESSFFRLLSHLNPRQLEAALLEWQDHVLGKRNPAGDQVAVDGKELLNSQGLQIASAYSVRDGRWLGSEAVAEGSNEIPAVQELSAGSSSRVHWSPPTPCILKLKRRGLSCRNEVRLPLHGQRAIRRASRKTCDNSTKVWRTLFPPKVKTAAAQTCETQSQPHGGALAFIPFDNHGPSRGFPLRGAGARLDPLL